MVRADLTDNFGSLYNVMDIHGISPLFLDGMHNLIETDLPDPIKWTLLGVRYVYTDWQELPIPSQIVATGTDRYGEINLHQLETPRSFATIFYRTATVSSDDQADTMLHDPNFDYRRVAILDRETGINHSAAPDETPASVVSFAPESITIDAHPMSDGILALAMPQYPGWYATVDEQPTEIMRAYGALAAIQLKQGDHLVRLVYNPLELSRWRIAERVYLDWDDPIWNSCIRAGDREAKNQRQATKVRLNAIDQRGTKLGRSAGSTGICPPDRPRHWRNWRTGRLADRRLRSAAGGGRGTGRADRTVHPDERNWRALCHDRGRGAAALRHTSRQNWLHADVHRRCDGRVPAGLLVPVDDGTTTGIPKFFRIRLTPAHAPLLLYIGWLIWSFVFGLRYAAPTTQILRQFAETLLSISMVFVLVDLLRDPVSLRRLVLVVMVIAGTEALIALILYVLPDTLAERTLIRLARIGYPNGGVIRYVEDNPALAERAIGTWVDPNALGGFLAVTATMIAPQVSRASRSCAGELYRGACSESQR